MANSDAHRAIVQQSNSLYRQLGLQPFLISLPLHGSTASINKKGIRDKILKNRSYVVTELNPLEANLTREMPEAVHGVETMVERLTDNDIMGFVFVVAEVLSEDDYRPVAGAVVELLDEHERSIRGMWCRRSLPDELVSLLLKVTAIRLFANAFELPTPGQRVRNSNKLISTLETTCLTFPREASDFFTTTLEMSKHWETEGKAGTHNDHPTVKCNCRKLAGGEGAWQFWGISETRFVKNSKVNVELHLPQTVPNKYKNYFWRESMDQPRKDTAGRQLVEGNSNSRKGRKRERKLEPEEAKKLAVDTPSTSHR
eukprot:GHVS01026906.1.p1 GENE.GHVS01026906.1~~GHVS01026906.1.p1  ORF type:complete len:313 (+),score=43.60 GHVS01026906.1:481-1419(+)